MYHLNMNKIVVTVLDNYYSELAGSYSSFEELRQKTLDYCEKNRNYCGGSDWIIIDKENKTLKYEEIYSGMDEEDDIIYTIIAYLEY